MALNTNDFAADAQAQAAAAQASAGFAQAKPQAREIRYSFTSGTGFEDVGALQNASVAISGLKKIFEEKYKDTNIKTRVIPMLRETFGEKFRYSSLIVAACTVDRDSSTMNVAYHILLVEASNPVKPENYKLGNNNPVLQVNLPRFACDGIDEEYIEAARSLVERSYTTNPEAGASKLQIIPANSEVIPENEKLDDPEKAGSLAVNALMAVVQALKRLSKQPAFNLAETEATPFTLEHIFRDGSIQDLNGQAVRSDIIVKMIARSGQKRNQFSLNGGSDGTPVALSSMFIDLLYTGREQTGFNMFSQQKEVKPCFVPRAVVTNTISYKGASLEMFLLSLYSAYSVFESGAARRSLANRQQKKGDLFDMSDIGAANVLANLGNDGGALGPIYTTRGAEVTDAYKYGLLETILHKTQLLAVDCQKAGPAAWQTHALQQAAEAGQNGKIGSQALIQAAMNLTDGNFAANFPVGTPVVAMAELITLGQWTDLEGNERDNREFDTLAILNRYGADNHEMVSKWINAQTDTSGTIPPEVRLSQTVSIVEDASGMRARHTGRGIRVTLHPMFMHALSEGIKATQHTFTPADMYADLGTNNLRGAQFLNWSQLAANASLNGPAYNRAGLDSVMRNNLFSGLFTA